MAEIQARIEAGLRAIVGITEAQVVQALSNFETRFVEQHEKLANSDSVYEFDRKVGEVVERFKESGLSRKAYLAAAAWHTQLFIHSPARVIGNVAGVVERFKDAGLTEKGYVPAALKKPLRFPLGSGVRFPR